MTTKNSANASQADLGFTEPKTSGGPVECLGMTFESDEARRVHFFGLLREKLQDPEFRKTPGFPEARDEDILRLSDPPYYTACPNPFVITHVRQHLSGSNAAPVDAPYVGDFEVDSRNPVYLYHPYHTKVPPDVIATLIQHYTKPGDLVLDVFGGSGMTGTAAAMTGRNSVVVDLSPVATFISSINTWRVPEKRVSAAMKQLLSESKRELGWLYETSENGRRLEVDYFVRTDVFNCPECAIEFPFFPHGVIHHGDKVETRKQFPCPGCGVELNVRRVERVLIHEGKKATLAWVKAGRGKTAISRAPNEHDLAVARRAEEERPGVWYPTNAIDPDGYSAKLAQLGAKQIDNVSRFLSPRNLKIFADLWERASRQEDADVRRALLSLLTSSFTVLSERQGYFGGGGGMSGNLYMPIVRMERNPWSSIERKLGRLKKAEEAKTPWRVRPFVSTQSGTALSDMPDESVDYVYTDPPFGANIIYSEMNLILEGWLRTVTAPAEEAVVDESRSRDEYAYGTLMRRAFKECHRVLKRGRWITVEFHNTKASIWNLIQTALGEAGFVVAQVGILNKGSTTILADIRPGAAKHDLLISAYKPTSALEREMATPGERDPDRTAEAFIREHLARVAVHAVGSSEVSDVVAERLPHVLYDRFLAFHVGRGFRVPLSAQELLRLLDERFPKRDEMYFLPDQVSEYDRWRARIKKVEQLSLFISDEQTAISWLRSTLGKRPQAFKDIHPAFMQSMRGWAGHEQQIELGRILAENFLHYDGRGAVPSQIHSYLSSNYKDLRSLEKDDPRLKDRASDRWYVPDPTKQADLDQLRDRALLKEFEEYKASTQRKLSVFRTEAVRSGFKQAWQARDYGTIVRVAEKLPSDVLQEDATLLMYYDNALTRLGDE